MKALTFKKTAVAVALITASGVASAANSLIVTRGDTPAQLLTATAATTPASDAKLTIASERATDKAFEYVAAVTPGSGGAASGGLIAYKATSLAPQNGNLIKINFTNGGIAGNANNYKVVFSDVSNSGSFGNAATQIVAKEESNGVISSLTLVVNVNTIETGDTLTLVNATSTTLGAPGSAILISPAFMLDKGAASGSSVTVDWQLIDAANGNEITGGAVSPVTTASATSAVKITGFASNPDVIDYAKDALQLVDGKTANTDTDFLVAANSAVTTSSGLGFESGHAAKASFTVKADNCAAVNTGDNNKAADDVIIGSTGLTASTTQACTWTSGLIDVKAAANLAVKLDGTTTLTNAKWTYEGKVTLSTADFTVLTDSNIYAKEYKTVSGTAFTFTSDVQGDAFELPYIYHIGTGTGYSSFVKLVNKTAKSTAANANNTVEVAFDAVILNTVTKEEFTVSNYKLGSIMNEGQYSFSGADVIKALKTPLGKATDGFNETAMDLDTAQNYHIALRLIPRNVSNNANFYVDVQNTAPVGRAQGAAERK